MSLSGPVGDRGKQRADEISLLQRADEISLLRMR